MNEGEFRCELLDPPWPERGGGKIKRGADRHYSLLRVSEIPDVIRSSPLWRPDPSGCHVWLWATDNHLRDALGVLDVLGARYVRTAVWAKDRIGLGQYLRSQHELLLLAVIGRLPAQTRSTSSLIVAPRRRHSQKPDESYSLIEAVSPGPRAELFARTRRPGWESWGDELEVANG